MAFEKHSSLPAGLTREDRYILHNYYRLTAWPERWGHKLLLAKARGDAEMCETMRRRLARQWLEKSPTLAEVESMNLPKFLANVAQRILRDNPERVQWRRCPKCNALARTPRAHLCPDCGEIW